MPQKKKSSDSVNASACSEVRPTLMILYLALAQTENDLRYISGLGFDNCAYSTVVRKAYCVCHSVAA